MLEVAPTSALDAASERMYQHGQGVEPDDAKAVTWYRMSADQGNRHGINNLDYFKAVLKERGSGVWEAASNPVTDAAIARAQRCTNGVLGN